MIKMNKKSKNNLNFSKDLSLNIKISSKNQDAFFKTNNTSLDFVSSPIKNSKKVIKRNTRTTSYSSLLYNQTENIISNKNPFNSNKISADSNNKINLNKNIFTFSNLKPTLGDNNSKNKTNNNLKKNKNKKCKQNIKSRTKPKNITAHQSTSNLAKYNIILNTENNINNFINNNNSNEYLNVKTNPNNTSQFILNRKRNQKGNNHSHFQHSNLLNSNEFNYMKDNNNNFNSFSQQEKIEKTGKEKDKLYFRNNNQTAKNLLFLTRQNLNTKKYLEKNKESLSKKSKLQKMLNEQFFNSNINKNINNTTKNSEDAKGIKISKNRTNNNINNNITNYLELSTDEQNKNIINDFELLYNCLKKRYEGNSRGTRKSEKKDKSNKNNRKRKKYNLLEDEDSLLGIMYENKQIKQKNLELSQQFENMKKEFELIKKDNKEIKEELKEKSKYLKDIKLTMDIFSQELLKLQSLYKENENSNNKSINPNNFNKNLNLKLIENETNKEKDNSNIGNISKRKKINDLKINNINNINPKVINNIIENANNKNDQKIINIYDTDINNNININNICLTKINKLEKIHQLSLNNINNIINQQNKKRGGSLEANNFQDTSKIINIETKDTTEKENECLNDKWPSPLYPEKDKEKELNNKDLSKQDEEESIDLTNISLADNLNINQEVYNNALKLKKSNVGKLDFKNTLVNKNSEDNQFKKKVKNLNCTNQGIVSDNFNEEFLKYYDKFSDSWRKEVDKMLKKGKEKE